MTLQTKKDKFPSSQENKQRFIIMLGNKLEKPGCDVRHAKGDAYLLVVEVVQRCAEHIDTVVIADTTYILVLLIQQPGTCQPQDTT